MTLLGRVRLLPRVALQLIGSVRVVVSGPSMAPALLPGDRLLLGRIALLLHSPLRGQIVLLRRRDDPATLECIKRIVGLPHERIRIAAGRVFIDGHPLAEPYLQGSPTSTAAGQAIGAPGREWQLNAGQYFVLGDNRAWSTDSRSYGPVRRSELRGVAWYRYFPTHRRGRISD